MAHHFRAGSRIVSPLRTVSGFVLTVYSCPAKAQCYRNVYDMEYEEPAEDIFDDNFWGNWLDDVPDEI